MRKLVMMAATLVISSSAIAEPNLATKERRKQGMSYVELELKSIAHDCGVDMDAAIDWDSFKWDDKHAEPAAGTTCRAAVAQISYLCRRGGDYKAAVVKKLRHVTCGYGDQESFAVGGDTFHVVFNFKNVNLGDRALKALTEQL